MQVNATVPWQSQDLRGQKLAKGNNNKKVKVLCLNRLNGRLAGRVEASKILGSQQVDSPFKRDSTNRRGL
jgi:hypothetical protein